MIKFIHAADIHLDSPLRGLESYEGAPVEEIRGATRKAFVNLINLALEEKVSFVVISGDLYDGDWKDYNTGLFLLTQLSKLSSQGIPVFIAKGNHDAESKMTRDLRPPEGIKIFSSRAPETFILEDLDVAIHGQSFATAAVTRDLASSYPPPKPGLFNIGVLHTSVNGREGHENYAPCTVDTLQSKGYDYWALGHVHKREVLSEDPWIVFPGNIQGRHIKETGPKGCTIVSLEDGAVISVEQHNLHTLVWSLCEVDASGAAYPQDVVERVKENVEKAYLRNNKDFTAARVRVHGRCKAHGQLSDNIEKWINEMRLAIADACGGSVWLEKISMQTSIEADLEQISKRNDAIGDLLRYIESLDQAEGRELPGLITGEITDLRAKLPPELGQGLKDLESKEKSSGVLEEVKQLLISRLLSSGAEQ
jgi:DNA repair exonuclease SbcCD nuclease subunit